MSDGHMFASCARNVRKGDDSIHVIGVDRLTHGTGVPNSYISALCSVLHACGVKCSYGVLMGMSGMAFRLLLDKDTGPSVRAWGADVGLGCAQSAWRCAGFSPRHCYRGGPGKQAKDAFVATIRSALEDGMPWVANDICGDGLHGVVAGLEGDTLLCRVLGDDSNGYRRSDCMLSEAVTLGTPLEVAPVGVAFDDSLRRAVALAYVGEVSTEEGRLVCGVGAYDVWSDWLRDEASRCEQDDLELERSARANELVYRWLVDAREGVPGYLRNLAGELGGARVGGGVSDAATLYARLAGKLKSGIALTDAEAGQWGPGQRESQAALLEECAELEARAVRAIEQTLALVAG